MRLHNASQKRPKEMARREKQPEKAGRRMRKLAPKRPNEFDINRTAYEFIPAETEPSAGKD